ncbi:hypothetical protein [Ewingella americana]|nr:hypothetical protein [Ewingella americana]
MNLKLFVTVFSASAAGVMLAQGVRGWWLVAAVGLYCLYTNDKR